VASFLIGLILTGITIYFSCILESTSLALLGFAEAFVLVLSFVTIISRFRYAKAYIEVPISIAEKDRPFNILVVVKNSMKYGYRRMRFKVSFGNAMKKKMKDIWLNADNIPMGKSEFAYEIMISHPGNYELAVKKVRIYDYLGLFYLTKRMKKTANAMVLPEIHEIPVKVGDRIRNYTGETEAFDELRPGFEPSETFGVREFRPGDKLPRVHWKLSAKVDDLMIRENSRTAACAVILFMNLDWKCYDELLDKAVGLSFSMMDAGCQHFVSWFSSSRGDVIRTRVEDEESFFTFLVSYMQDVSADKTDNLVELYRDKYRGETGLYEFMFADGKITQNGDLITDEDLNEIIIN